MSVLMNKSLDKDLLFYCLFKQVYKDKEKDVVSMQSFFSLCDRTSNPPEVANVAYITVLDEKADSKDSASRNQ